MGRIWIDSKSLAATARPRPSPSVSSSTATSRATSSPLRSDERDRRTVYDLLPPGLPWLFPAGRLDADSEGLLILTNDSDLSTRLTAPEHAVPKTYRVTVAGHPDEATLQRLRDGVELSDGPTRPAQVRLLRAAEKKSVLEIVLTEGRNRQLRRMGAAVGHKVRGQFASPSAESRVGRSCGWASRVLDEAEQLQYGLAPAAATEYLRVAANRFQVSRDAEVLRSGNAQARPQAANQTKAVPRH